MSNIPTYLSYQYRIYEIFIGEGTEVQNPQLVKRIVIFLWRTKYLTESLGMMDVRGSGVACNEVGSLKIYKQATRYIVLYSIFVFLIFCSAS